MAFQWRWVIGCGLLTTCGWGQKSLELSPARPTIANSVGIQDKGVLQVEVGYDAYPGTPPGEQQSVDTAMYYSVTKAVRLDFGWSAFEQQNDGVDHAMGVGTITFGTKVKLWEDKIHPWLPAVGVQYEAEMPTASTTALQGYGQQGILIVNRHFGPTDLILNGSVVQTDCQTATGCRVGGQQSMALSYRASKKNSLYAEVFGQNVDASSTPPGTYAFGGFVHRFSDSFGINGGLRFGVSDHSSSFGTTVGIVIGKRLRGDGVPPR